MTSFADALSSSRRAAGVPCSFAEIKAGLSKKDRADLEAAVAQPSSVLTHSHIARALSQVSGRKIDADIIGRHRRGDCRACAEA